MRQTNLSVTDLIGRLSGSPSCGSAPEHGLPSGCIANELGTIYAESSGADKQKAEEALIKLLEHHNEGMRWIAWKYLSLSQVKHSDPVKHATAVFQMNPENEGLVKYG